VLLDEILAVGDGAFRNQCKARIERFVTTGATVVLVSHELDAIQSMCSRTIWMAGGRIVDDGPTADVISRYERFVAGGDSTFQSKAPASA
jgi:ABC-type polysaccharide/polyol phosphate transport system ATPase subunit